MAHDLVQSHMIANVAAALAKSESVNKNPHNGLKGKAKEIFAKDLINPLLPPQFAIGNGQIIDCHGNTSPECDLIIYDKSVLPPILLDESTGLFPIESCYYAVEVKSKLTAGEIRKTLLNFQKLWELKPMKSNTNRPVPAIFAFTSDLNSQSELERYEKYDSTRNELNSPKCLALCVAQKGYHYFSNKEAEWKTFDGDKKYDEIINFLGGIANTLYQPQPRRNAISFGNYFMKQISPNKGKARP